MTFNKLPKEKYDIFKISRQEKIILAKQTEKSCQGINWIIFGVSSV